MPYGLELPHPENDHDKTLEIAESMRVNGWVGAPIVIDGEPRNGQALTGCHRLVAAELAGVASIPTITWQDVLAEDGIDVDAFLADYLDNQDTRDLAVEVSNAVSEATKDKYGLDAH